MFQKHQPDHDSTGKMLIHNLNDLGLPPFGAPPPVTAPKRLLRVTDSQTVHPIIDEINETIMVKSVCHEVEILHKSPVI